MLVWTHGEPVGRATVPPCSISMPGQTPWRVPITGSPLSRQMPRRSGIPMAARPAARKRFAALVEVCFEHHAAHAERGHLVGCFRIGANPPSATMPLWAAAFTNSTLHRGLSTSTQFTAVPASSSSERGSALGQRMGIQSGGLVTEPPESGASQDSKIRRIFVCKA